MHFLEKILCYNDQKLKPLNSNFKSHSAQQASEIQERKESVSENEIIEYERKERNAEIYLEKPAISLSIKCDNEHSKFARENACVERMLHEIGGEEI